MSSVNFTDSPVDGASFTNGNSTFIYKGAQGVWDRIISTRDISIYATLANMPLSGVDEGTLAKVLDTNKLYKWTGTGWYYLSPVNTNPNITTTGDAAYTLANDGTPTVVTLEANDPEGIPITWSYAVTTGSLGSTATVSQADNVFTITPSTLRADAGGFTLTFTASDGVNLATSASEFSLAFAADWSLAATQQAKIQATDLEANDRFGDTVSISGDGNTAIVGARLEDEGGTNAGAAYIFTRSGSTWTEQAKLLPSDVASNDNFGWAVSISNDGNTVIVGSQLDDLPTSGGAAYIFTRSGSTWTEQAKIRSSDIEASDEFGISVSISADGNTVIVGASKEDTGGDQAGAAYIFTRSGSTWSQQAKIQSSDIAAFDEFGYRVAISGDGNTVIVAAYLEDTVDLSEGAAYIFTRSGSTWTEQAKLKSSDKSNSDFFGQGVSISSDSNTVIVGAKFEDAGGSNAGAAYIFTRSGSTWTEEARLLASDSSSNDTFGYSVSITGDGNTVIVGAWSEDTGATDAGAAYIFTRSGSTWTEQAKIQASDAEASDQFGLSVSISSDASTAIVSAHFEDTGAATAGSAYIFVAG